MGMEEAAIRDMIEHLGAAADDAGVRGRGPRRGGCSAAAGWTKEIKTACISVLLPHTLLIATVGGCSRLSLEQDKQGRQPCWADPARPCGDAGKQCCSCEEASHLVLPKVRNTDLIKEL